MRFLLGGTRAALIVMLLAGQAAVVSAQDSREAEIAAAQAEKAESLAPYTPSKLEMRVHQIQSALVGQPNGIYP